MYHKESYKYVPPKEANKALVTNPKEMDIYKLPNKEFFKNLSWMECMRIQIDN